MMKQMVVNFRQFFIKLNRVLAFLYQIFIYLHL